jgi:hypothetical protein
MKEQEQAGDLFEPSRLQLDDGRVVRVSPASLAIEVSDDHTVVVEPGSGEPQVVYSILGDIVRAAEIALDIYDKVKGGGGGGKQKCTRVHVCRVRGWLRALRPDRSLALALVLPRLCASRVSMPGSIAADIVGV